MSCCLSHLRESPMKEGSDFGLFLGSFVGYWHRVCHMVE